VDPPRVWCWGDLWAAVRSATDDGPAVLSEAAARAVLRSALEEARQAGALASPAIATPAAKAAATHPTIAVFKLVICLILSLCLLSPLGHGGVRPP
jgi:hypothetical protein